MGSGVLSAAAVGIDFEPGVASPGGVLLCDAVPAAHIAEAVGTPAYVYSAGVVRRQYRRLDAARSSPKPRPTFRSPATHTPCVPLR